MFEDIDKCKNKIRSVQEPFSISRNLVMRRNDQVADETPPTFEKHLKNLTAVNLQYQSKKQAFDNQIGDDENLSFIDYMKSFFKGCGRKIKQPIQADMPLNLHLRMNEIFSTHDRLSDVAEILNDLYSMGNEC